MKATARSGIRGERGFTLTRVVVLVALCAAIAAGWKLHEGRKNREAIEKRLEAAAASVRDRARATVLSDTGWKATRTTSDNPRMGCLTEDTSCEGKAGLVNLRDGQNRVVIDSLTSSAGFSIEGYPCLGFLESGNDSCPLRAEVVWTPVCPDDCVKPKVSNLGLTILFKPGPGLSVPFSPAPYALTISRETDPAEPKNCAAALGAGHTQDGQLSIRPQPGGPLVTVYCDQTRDGGGWTLVANLSREVAEPISTDNLVTAASHAHLPTEVISQLLAASDFQNENNVRVKVPGIDNGFTFAFSANGITEAAVFNAAMPDGDCRGVPDKPNYATKGAVGRFGVVLKGAGLLVYDDVNRPGKGATGLSFCFGSRKDGTNCGTGCQSPWRGDVTNQKGSIWIR